MVDAFMIIIGWKLRQIIEKHLNPNLEIMPLVISGMENIYIKQVKLMAFEHMKAGTELNPDQNN